ncbi:predicted protein [Histoplasma capsulatum H143]|uniref:Uncharacterized protein n=1 Tax=Ajellomyces capsulatus (strain H143) TaxID=544712 RepID=C6HS46_AJECH|nr:predicted protein [Histoplasma capsulatum H143]
MVQRPSSTIIALLWLLALVDGQETPKDGSTLQPAEVLGMGVSPASPLFARGMLDIRQITAVAANPDGVVARQSVALRARIAAEEAAASIQEADVAAADLHANLAQFVIRPLGLGNAENLARM